MILGRSNYLLLFWDQYPTFKVFTDKKPGLTFDQTRFILQIQLGLSGVLNHYSQLFLKKEFISVKRLQIIHPTGIRIIFSKENFTDPIRISTLNHLRSEEHTSELQSRP